MINMRQRLTALSAACVMAGSVVATSTPAQADLYVGNGGELWVNSYTQGRDPASMNWGEGFQVFVPAVPGASIRSLYMGFVSEPSQECNDFTWIWFDDSQRLRPGPNVNAIVDMRVPSVWRGDTVRGKFMCLYLEAQVLEPARWPDDGFEEVEFVESERLYIPIKDGRVNPSILNVDLDPKPTIVFTGFKPTDLDPNFDRVTLRRPSVEGKKAKYVKAKETADIRFIIDGPINSEVDENGNYPAESAWSNVAAKRKVVIGVAERRRGDCREYDSKMVNNRDERDYTWSIEVPGRKGQYLCAFQETETFEGDARSITMFKPIK